MQAITMRGTIHLSQRTYRLDETLRPGRSGKAGSGSGELASFITTWT